MVSLMFYIILKISNNSKENLEYLKLKNENLILK